MTESKRSIDIVLTDNNVKVDGKQIGVVSEEVLQELNAIVNESEKYDREAEKLRVKNEKALRSANKLMKRIIISHGIEFDYETQAVGVAKSDTIYIGPKDRVKEAPDAEPQEGDIVVGTLLKYERRKYNEHLGNYEYLKRTVEDHNKKVFENEEKLISFEQQILVNTQYDSEKNFLAVYPTGKVFLCNR